jgi:hypothetical protein
MGRIHTLVFYAGAVWETGRFFFLFQLVSAVANPQANPLVSLLFLWLSSGQLCAALLFFLCGYMPGKFFGLRRITAVFTFMGLLPACLALVSQGFLRGLFPLAARISLGLAAPLVIVVGDALFLAYLLLSRKGVECT